MQFVLQQLLIESKSSTESPISNCNAQKLSSKHYQAIQIFILTVRDLFVSLSSSQ